MRVLTLSTGERTMEADGCARDLHLNIQFRGHSHVSSWVLHSEVFHLAQDKLDKLGDESDVPQLKVRLERRCSIHVVLNPQGDLTQVPSLEIEKIVEAIVQLVYYCTGNSGGDAVAESLQVLQVNKCHALVQELIRSVNTELRRLAILKGVGLTRRFELLLEREKVDARNFTKRNSSLKPEESSFPAKKKLQHKRERMRKVKRKLEKLQKLLGLKIEENMKLQLEVINLTSQNASHMPNKPVSPIPKQNGEGEAMRSEKKSTLAKDLKDEKMIQHVAEFMRKDFALCQVFSSMVLIQLTLYKLERSVNSDLLKRENTDERLRR